MIDPLHPEQTTIDAEIAALEKVPPEDAAELVAKADQILAAHADRMASLKAKRDEINEAFRVKSHERAEAEARARGAKHIELIDGIRAAEQRRLEAVERMEHHLRASVDAINEAFAAAGDVRGKALALARLAGIERISLPGLGQSDFASRTGGRIAGLFGTAIAGHPHRLGGIEFAGGALYPPKKIGWAEHERKAFAPDIEMVTGGTHDANRTS